MPLSSSNLNQFLPSFLSINGTAKDAPRVQVESVTIFGLASQSWPIQMEKEIYCRSLSGITVRTLGLILVI